MSRAITFTFAVIGLLSVPVRADGQELRYRWKAPERYIYSVKIEIEGEDIIEEMSGTSYYTVRAADQDGITLIHGGRLFPSRRAKQGIVSPIIPGRLGPGGPFSGVGIGLPNESELRIDAFGKVLRSSGDSQLPAMLGNLSDLVIEPLSPDGKKTWEVTGGANITEIKEGLPGPRFGRVGPRSPFGDSETTFTAGQKTTYTIAKTDGDLVQIKKQYELKTQETAGGAARLQMIGEGQITFDVKAGVPKAMEFKATMSENTANKTVRTPIKVTYKLLEGEELQQALKPPPPPAEKPKEERKVATADDVKQLLANLKSGNDAKAKAAAERLTQLDPNESRADVAKALEPLLEDDDRFTRQAATNAMGVWGSNENVPALVEVLKDEHVFARRAAMDALSKLKDERGADAVAARLTRHEDRNHASRALQEMGSVAEKAVAKVIDDSDFAVRLEACKILKAIGTGGSKTVLEKASRDKNGHVAKAAKDALKEVTKR